MEVARFKGSGGKESREGGVKFPPRAFVDPVVHYWLVGIEIRLAKRECESLDNA